MPSFARILVLLAAVATPIVSSLSQTGALGPTNGEVSARHPTLLVAAGYAFSIWGPIFLLDLLYGGWQATGRRREDPVLGRAAPWSAGGFLLTAIWSPLFSLEWFWVCLAVIVGALGCTLTAAFIFTRSGAPWLPRVALSLHAGWLSLAAFLNLALVVEAESLLGPPDLPWALALFAAAAALLLGANQAMRGNLAYAIAALWGLAAVFVKQREGALEGGEIAAWTALGIAGVLAAQTAFLVGRRVRASGAG